MSEHKHTPGPWETHIHRGDWGMRGCIDIVADAGERRIATVEFTTPYCLNASRRDRENYGVAIADARLIAAAPDLLAACEALVSRARQPHEGAFDWFERLAAMFTSETGLIPPGKDCPPQAADYKATTEQWHEWIRAPYSVGKAALALAKGETP